MIFTQAASIVLLAATLPIYYLTCRHLVLDRRVLIVASYVFHGWADLRFAVLSFISSCFDFYIALRIQRAADAPAALNRLRFMFWSPHAARTNLKLD